VALWSCVHSGRDHLVVVVHLLAARVAAMSDITKCAGYIEKDRPPVSRTLCGWQTAGIKKAVAFGSAYLPVGGMRLRTKSLAHGSGASRCQLHVAIESSFRNMRACAASALESATSPTEFCWKIQDRTRDSYHAQLSVLWYREAHLRRVGRWCENLSVDEEAAITPLLLPLLRRWGYE
jgi:hypothetical protein